MNNHIKTILTGTLIRHSVGRSIFCPHCKNILDWQNAVLITVAKEGTNETVFSKSYCGPCFDNRISRNLDLASKEASSKYGPCHVETDDGREWLNEMTKLQYTVDPSAKARTVYSPKGEPIAVASHLVMLPEAPWASFFVHQDAKSSQWHFSDKQTGSLIARSGTQKGAICAGAKAVMGVTREHYLDRQLRVELKITRAQKKAAKAAAVAA